MTRIVLVDKSTKLIFNPNNAHVVDSTIVLDLDDNDGCDDKNKPHHLNVPISLRPTYNIYTQKWHRETLDKLNQIFTFIQLRFYYCRISGGGDDSHNYLIIQSIDINKCLLILFYFLTRYHWGEANRVDAEMLKYKQDWCLTDSFPNLFTQTIIYPLLINSYYIND